MSALIFGSYQTTKMTVQLASAAILA